MVSHRNNSWAADMGFAHENGVHPGVASFVRDDSGQIYAIATSGFGPRDNFCNMWDFIDLLPAGVNDWVPKYDY